MIIVGVYSLSYVPGWAADKLNSDVCRGDISEFSICEETAQQIPYILLLDTKCAILKIRASSIAW